MKSILAFGIVLTLTTVAHAQYAPISLTPASYNQDVVVEQSAPHPFPPPTTASLDAGTGNTGFSWYEVGENPSASTTGIPAAGSTFASESQSNHSYRMAPNYTNNDAVLIDSTVTGDTVTPGSPSAFSSLSFLLSSGGGSVTINYTVHHA